MYQIRTVDNGDSIYEVIVRLSDNANIPADPENLDYQDYLVWVEQEQKS